MRRALALGALGLAWMSVLAGGAADARGDATAALLVSGGERGAEVVRAAAAAELGRAGWRLPALSSAAAESLRGCLGAEAAWPCLEPRLLERGLTKLVAIQLAIEPAGKAEAALRLVGQLGSLEGRRLTAQSRYCRRCDDAQLAEAARLLVRRLIAASAVRDDATRIEIRTQPPGAVLRLDGRLVEAPGGVIACSPGLHTVHVQRSGYRSELRAVLVEEGKAVALEVTLLPERAGATSRGGPVASIERIEIGGDGERAGERDERGGERDQRGVTRSELGERDERGGSERGDQRADAPGGEEARRDGGGRDGARRDEAMAPGRPSWPGPHAQPDPRALAVSPGRRSQRPTKPARRAPKLAWLLSLGGGALLAAGATLLWLDEDARDDASVPHSPRYFDSAPAGVALVTVGGLAAVTGVVLFVAPAAPAPAMRSPSSAAAEPSSAAAGAAGWPSWWSAPASSSGRGPAGAAPPALLLGLRGAF